MSNTIDAQAPIIDETMSIAPSQTNTLVNPRDEAISTATGRPNRDPEPSGLRNIPGMGIVGQAPQFLPIKFHDEDVIPVPVMVANEGVKEVAEEVETEEKRGFMGKMRGLVSSSGKNKEDGKLRVVYMPRGEYLKLFAKDDAGNYVGTDPQRNWTNMELDEKFGEYQKAAGKAK